MTVIFFFMASLPSVYPFRFAWTGFTFIAPLQAAEDPIVESCRFGFDQTVGYFTREISAEEPDPTSDKTSVPQTLRKRFVTLRKIFRDATNPKVFLESNQKYRSPKPGFIWSLLCPFLWRHLLHPSRYICSEGPSRAAGDTQIKVLRNELKRRFLIPGSALRESKLYRVLFLSNKLNQEVPVPFWVAHN